MEAIAAALGVEVMTLLYGPKPKEIPSRKRLLAGGVCLVVSLLLWAAGKFWLRPYIEYWAQRHYQLGQVYFYELVYEGTMVFLFALGPLLLASAIWNLELKKTGRLACLVMGVAVGFVWLSSWACVLAMVFTEWHAPFHKIFVYLVKFQYEAWGSVVEGIAILFLFLAFNPSKKKRE